MIDDFFERYYADNIIRGVQIFEKRLVYKSLFILLALLGLWTLFLFHQDFWIFLILARVFILMGKINKEMDAIAKEHAVRSSLRTKNYVIKNLKEKMYFNHSVQFKELALFLRNKGEKNLKSYNVVPYIAMILTILLFLFRLISQTNPDSIEEIIIIMMIVSVIVLTFNLVLNTITNLFFNGKPMVMLNLSDLIFELYLEESVKENRLLTSEAKAQKIKNKTTG